MANTARDGPPGGVKRVVADTNSLLHRHGHCMEAGHGQAWAGKLVRE